MLSTLSLPGAQALVAWLKLWRSASPGSGGDSNESISDTPSVNSVRRRLRRWARRLATKQQPVSRMAAKKGPSASDPARVEGPGHRLAECPPRPMGPIRTLCSATRQYQHASSSVESSRQPQGGPGDDVRPGGKG